MQGLSLVLGEGALKDGEERDQPMEEDSVDAELLSGYQWLLQDLPKLPLFESVRGMTSTALQQVRTQQWRPCGHLKQLAEFMISYLSLKAIHMETDPQMISAYLIYLSQHAPVEEQASHNDLALVILLFLALSCVLCWRKSHLQSSPLPPPQDVARLIVERSTIMNSLFSKHLCRPESDAVLSALLNIFSAYIKRMRKTKEGEDLYSWVSTKPIWINLCLNVVQTG